MSAQPPTAPVPLPRPRARGRATVAAVILIALGVLFLLANLGLVPRLGPLIAQWWPLILVAVGASLLLRR
jgi:lipopolysaccharide export LptBFGC system permease protein LptF